MEKVPEKKPDQMAKVKSMTPEEFKKTAREASKAVDRWPEWMRLGSSTRRIFKQARIVDDKQFHDKDPSDAPVPRSYNGPTGS